MPTEVFLLDLDEDGIRASILEVLRYKGEFGVYIALVVIFEGLVVLASLQEGYTRADTECLRKLDRPATKKLKYVRDIIAHAFYDKTELHSKIVELSKMNAIGRLCKKLYKQMDTTNLCSEFNKEIVNLFGADKVRTTKQESCLQKVLGLIPPSVRGKYSGSDVDVALQFAYEQLTR